MVILGQASPIHEIELQIEKKSRKKEEEILEKEGRRNYFSRLVFALFLEIIKLSR